MFVITSDGKTFQVCQTDEGEEIWNEDVTELLAKGDFVQVVNGVITCIERADSVFSHGTEAEDRE